MLPKQLMCGNCWCFREGDVLTVTQMESEAVTSSTDAGENEAVIGNV